MKKKGFNVTTPAEVVAALNHGQVISNTTADFIDIDRKYWENSRSTDPVSTNEICVLGRLTEILYTSCGDFFVHANIYSYSACVQIRWRFTRCSSKIHDIKSPDFLVVKTSDIVMMTVLCIPLPLKTGYRENPSKTVR